MRNHFYYEWQNLPTNFGKFHNFKAEFSDVVFAAARAKVDAAR